MEGVSPARGPARGPRGGGKPTAPLKRLIDGIFKVLGRLADRSPAAACGGSGGLQPWHAAVFNPLRHASSAPACSTHRRRPPAHTLWLFNDVREILKPATHVAPHPPSPPAIRPGRGLLVGGHEQSGGESYTAVDSDVTGPVAQYTVPGTDVLVVDTTGGRWG